MSINPGISCTGCAFCSDRCPMDIPIPVYLNWYKEVPSGDGKGTPLEQYAELSAGRPKASDCIHCGRCEGVCPEHLPILSFLQDIAEDYEDY